MKKMLIVGMILAIFMNGGTFTVLGAYHPVYGEVIFDDGFIQASLESSCDREFNICTRVESDPKGKEIMKDRGDGVYVYCGHASSCKNFDLVGALVEEYNRKSNPLDEPEGGTTSLSTKKNGKNQNRVYEKDGVYDFSCDADPLATFRVVKPFVPQGNRMLVDHIVMRKNENIQWKSDRSAREVDSQGIIIPKGSLNKDNGGKFYLQDTGLEDYLSHFGKLTRELWAQDASDYGYYLDKEWVTFDRHTYIYHPELKKIYRIKPLRIMVENYNTNTINYPAGLVECTLKKNGKILQIGSDIPTSSKVSVNSSGLIEKERIAQELGATRVQILEEVLKLLAQKPKADQEKIYQIVKTFTESEDPYTQNIGKYMILSIVPN